MRPGEGAARKIDVVGHRGASGYAPETTMASYRVAIAMGADFVETDVRLSQDGVPVAFHDADLCRTTNGAGAVADRTLSELKSLDAGSWFNHAYPDRAKAEYAGLRIPSLREVLELVRESPAGLFVEIKDPEPFSGSLESSLLSLVRDTRMEGRTHVLSFSAESLVRIRELDASVPTVLLVAKPDRNPVEAALEIRAGELGILHTEATPALVLEARGKGLRLSVWTVDRPKDMRRAIALGVDRITTNYPDRLIGELARG